MDLGQDFWDERGFFGEGRCFKSCFVVIDMKLMLTSAGVKNKSLEKALRKLVGGEMKIAFIPTAANIMDEEKSWQINGLNQCLGLGEVDIVDVSALEKDVWLPRLEKANVIVVWGGNATYLMKWVVKSGLVDELRGLLKTRVYVGASSGAIILSKVVFFGFEHFYGVGDEGEDDCEGLGYVDFYFRPHLNDSYFSKVRGENFKKLAPKFDSDLYVMDDESGIVWIDGEIEVVGEGKWIKFSGKKKLD